MDNPGYSFVIPSYNDAGNLARQFEFFFRRSEQIQLIIVDDHSTDDTPNLVRGATAPPNVEIRYLRQEEQGGPGRARNHGMQYLDREHTLFLDADDLLADYFFEYANMFPLGNSIDFSLFKYHVAHKPSHRYTYNMHHNDNAFFSSFRAGAFPVEPETVESAVGAVSTTNFPWNKLYRTQFLMDADIRFPDIRMHEDISVHWRSFMRSQAFSILSWMPPLITHYESQGGQRATNYIGEHRLHIFPELSELLKEIRISEYESTLIVEFKRFTDRLFSWMTGRLFEGASRDQLEWRPLYRSEIAKFKHAMRKEL